VIVFSVPVRLEEGGMTMYRLIGLWSKKGELVGLQGLV